MPKVDGGVIMMHSILVLAQFNTSEHLDVISIDSMRHHFSVPRYILALSLNVAGTSARLLRSPPTVTFSTFPHTTILAMGTHPSPFDRAAASSPAASCQHAWTIVDLVDLSDFAQEPLGNIDPHDDVTDLVVG